MPLLTRPVSELTDHVFMPITRQVAHRLLSSLGYADIIGDQIYINADWAAHSITSNANDNANTRQNRLSIETNLQMNPTSQKWDCYTFYHTTAYGINQLTLHNSDPIYSDINTQVEITEMVSPVTIVMNCDLVLDSSEYAFQTPQMIFNAHENGAVYSYTDLFFDYPVPKPIVSMLIQFWKMDRQFGQQANITFEEYVKIRSNNGWQVHKHRELDEYEIVVPVYDLKTLCTLEYSEDRPSGVQENKLPVGWSIPFVYTIQFAMPTLNILKYPIVINNQMLPDNCIITNKHIRHNTLEEFHHGKADEAYTKYTNNPNRFRVPDQWIYPWYDDWVVPTDCELMKKHRSAVAIIDLTVEEDTNTNVIPLKEDFDNDFRLTPLIKEFLYQEDSDATDMYSPYTVSVFRNNKQLSQDSIKFDENLNLTFTADSKYAIYRVVISIATDIYNIRPKWYSLIAKYYKYLPRDLKVSFYNRLVGGDWAAGIPKKTTYIDHDTATMYNHHGDILLNIEDFDFDRYTKAERSIHLEDRSIFYHVNQYGGSSQDEIDTGNPNKGNIGRANQARVDGGISANANNQHVRVTSTTFVAGEIH